MATIYKTGNSLVVTLNENILRPLGLEKGSKVDISLSLNGEIIIKPISKKDDNR